MMIAGNNYINRNINNTNRNKDKQKSNINLEKENNGSKKILITGGAMIFTAGSIYLAGKNGYLGNRIRNIFSKESSRVINSIKSPTQRINQAEKDILGYEIAPVKISDIRASEEAIERSKYSPLEAEYDKIRQDIARNPNNQARYEEIITDLKNTAKEIDNEFQTIHKEDKHYEGGVIERAILQKRYFSISGNEKEGYCCLDPLEYKKAREEAIDIQTGYYLLEPYQNGGRDFFDNRKNNTELLKGLREKYKEIKEEDSVFIDECIEKLNSEGAICAGHNSKLHAHELAKFGRIFREAMGISVK